MADGPNGTSTSRTVLLIVALLVVLALAAWQFGLFGTGQEEGREVYKVDATDKSGGELIVTEQTPAVPVTLPKTEMTNVPPEESPSPAASPAATPTGAAD